MDRLLTALGVGTGGIVIVPKALEKIEDQVHLVVSAVPKPSILMYDITEGAYSHVFTISDLIAVLATVSTLIFLAMAVHKKLKGEPPKRRKEDNSNN